MRLSITSNDGDFKVVEVSADILVSDLKPVIELELSIPARDQKIVFEGVELTDTSKTLAFYNIKEDDILLVVGNRTSPQQMNDPEQIRQQILSNPDLVRQLQQVSVSYSCLICKTNPQLLEAARNNPRMFAEIVSRESQRINGGAPNHVNNADDPFDVEAQRKIEMMIQRENIDKNMESAMEHNPESFGRVTMLYIHVQCNGVPVKAFVDSGAQATIMSPSCAANCNIMHLVDVRFAGMAVGVGTAKILGRVHSAQIKVGSQFLPCSFTIMEGKDVDLLFGLDMLMRHQAIIDLKQRVLLINNERIEFLAEHELPKNARTPIASSENLDGMLDYSLADYQVPMSVETVKPVAKPVVSTPAPPAQAAVFPESSLKCLMDLGFSRSESQLALAACNGNIDAAANTLFQM